MAATAPPFFADRMPPEHPRTTAAERTAYDRYLAARNHYKEELLDEVVAAASDSPGGPVLEVGTGYGALGVELLRRAAREAPLELHAVCESEAARELYARRLHEAGVTARLRVAPGGVPDPDDAAWRGRRFGTVYSANAFNTWPDPAGALGRLAALTAPGGRVLVNDLRRDPDPFILEYSLREMADDTSEEGRYRLRTYLTSLQGAYTRAEVRALLRHAGLTSWTAAPDGPMALTLRFRRAVARTRPDPPASTAPSDPWRSP
ncbi:class I SAM-dependent methyltransferase [Streptomyces sp. DASNCL29]|uniref:class I SAM-dependent methyltransferase n=1 Tax=Streptomyces sp. DASNCL29 TaxID=2583819 RepID=UPI00110FF285|nr:class I SAM-dependent methyltransferase [Streptomyces sp. DASNCL29]TMU99992.1 class I SAM-dependent methyltransferase [Streptomyces sp. DASNCL29]